MRQKVEIIGLIIISVISYTGILSNTMNTIGNAVGITHFAIVSLGMSFWISTCIIMEFYEQYKPNTVEIVTSLVLTVNYIQLYLHSEISFLASAPSLINAPTIAIVGTIIWFAQIIIGVLLVTSIVGPDRVDKRRRDRIDDPYGDKHAQDILKD